MQQIRDFQVRGFMSSVSSAVATGTQIFRPPQLDLFDSPPFELTLVIGVLP